MFFIIGKKGILLKNTAKGGCRSRYFLSLLVYPEAGDLSVAIRFVSENAVESAFLVEAPESLVNDRRKLLQISLIPRGDRGL